MIFKRALQRELASTAGAVFTILFTIAITVRPIKILGMAASGKVDSDDVFTLIGFAALNLLPIIIVLTGFISVLMVVTRSYQDSEMVVWFASGVSLTNWIVPILRFAAPLFVLTALMSFFVTPWANQHSVEYTDRFEQRSDIARVSPGKFQESASRERVFFVEGVAGDLSKVRNIFVNTIQNGRHSVVIAKEGEIVLDKFGDKFLIMHQGRRYDGAPNQTDFQMMQFDRYGVLVDSDTKALITEKKAEALSMSELWADQNPINMGELLWRISLPIMGVLLMVLAVPLGYVNPRSGRSANFLLALFLCVFYYNMVLVSQAWVKQSKFSLFLSWWPIHLACLLLITVLFVWRLNVNSRYHPLQIWAQLVRKKPACQVPQSAQGSAS
ncbi:LPS export ABC transporter permease LptF [Solimicrobium silvestre]|uniref:Lipopolysaccharide export system permease protein LptF n=1 Tax=Solimicrobium silvestre TaxID=2099400 RepID=A0A2S9H5P7_9BURK|nr:LPS export ABC transporter permease LptF [Solimicrobium silvestre]PRC95253.1 putative permease [Solimicrobium silvestre]